MRRLLLVVPFVFACAKGENPPADSAAAAPAPAMLTEADVAGTWSGTASTLTDSVFAHFTITCGTGTCRITSTENPKDTIPSTYVIAGDSSTGTSSPYAEPAVKGAMVVDHYVARVTAGTVNGTGHLTLADKPDSVVFRYKFTGTKTP